MSDIAKLLEQSLPDIIALLERKRYENEKVLVEGVLADQQKGLSLRASAALRGCHRNKVLWIRQKMKVVG